MKLQGVSAAEEYQRAVSEAENLRAFVDSLKLSAVVWTLMLRGDIAMPAMVRHADQRFNELGRTIDSCHIENSRLAGEKQAAEQRAAALEQEAAVQKRVAEALRIEVRELKEALGRVPPKA